MSSAKTPAILCGDSTCPNDTSFVHRFYFGCVPADFKERTGRSKTHYQTRGDDGRYRWNGGCNPHATSPSTGAERRNVHCGNGFLHEPHDRCNGAAQRWVKCDCSPIRCHHLEGGYWVDLPPSGAESRDDR